MRVPAGRGKAPERTIGLLQFEQLGFSCDGKQSQRCTRGDCARIDAGEQLPKRGRSLPCMRDLQWQSREKGALACGRIAKLERVEVFVRHPSNSCGLRFESLDTINS